MSRRQHGYPWPSLAISPYHSSPPAGLQGYILCPHIVAVCKFELVVLLLHGHMWGSILTCSKLFILIHYLIAFLSINCVMEVWTNHIQMPDRIRHNLFLFYNNCIFSLTINKLQFLEPSCVRCHSEIRNFIIKDSIKYENHLKNILLVKLCIFSFHE